MASKPKRKPFKPRNSCTSPLRNSPTDPKLIMSREEMSLRLRNLTSNNAWLNGGFPLIAIAREAHVHLTGLRNLRDQKIALYASHRLGAVCLNRVAAVIAEVETGRLVCNPRFAMIKTASSRVVVRNMTTYERFPVATKPMQNIGTIMVSRGAPPVIKHREQITMPVNEMPAEQQMPTFIDMLMGFQPTSTSSSVKPSVNKMNKVKTKEDYLIYPFEIKK